MLKRAATLTIAATFTAVALSACGSTTSDDNSSAGGPWKHTDASGKTVKLGLKPVGIYGDMPRKDDPNLKGLDLEGIANLGEVWGEIDVEKAATLNADLIVADWWPVEKQYSGLEEARRPRARSWSSSHRSSARLRATRS